MRLYVDPRKLRLPTPDEALVGRANYSFSVPTRHAVNGTSIQPPFAPGLEVFYLGMGCFWGAERKFWQTEGVVTTAVGYGGGLTPHPTYEEVCSGGTGHNELVEVVYDPRRVTFGELLRVFFENHDPTQGMRQGNDVGTQYRSGIYTTTPAQRAEAEEAKRAYDAALRAAGHGAVTTEIADAPPFYFAEDYHQQYLHKNPQGYCGLGGTGVSCPVGLGVSRASS